jgi:dTDP-4-amino-4,6-dideoxygalactose transaminase
MFYQLPPVGNPVCLSPGHATGAALNDAFSPYSPRYLASGTAALAAAVVAAIRLKSAADPEVILPAYGCPDLVSAVLHAGARPVLVDLVPDRPWMDLEQVSACINPATVAIIAVSLLGIPERMDGLGTLARESSVLLIEDSAQSFPQDGDMSFWSGDLVVLSFGRGKPVSLLGGGAVLYRDSRLGSLLPDAAAQGGNSVVAFRTQAILYNLMLSPRLYWVPQGLPFLNLGETRYHTLDRIQAMDEPRIGLLPANIEAYRRRSDRARETMAGLVERGAMGTALIDLPAACGTPQPRRLLRYPLLIERAERGRVYAELMRRGLGASIMYQVILPEVVGLEALFADAGEFPVARSFAARLLTLPLYERLSVADFTGIRECIGAGR